MSKFQELKNTKRAGITRRDFFKISAAAGAGGTVASLIDWAVVGPSPAIAAADKYVNSICPYCSVGCGLKIAVDSAQSNWDNKVVDIYGDTDHVVSNGALCSKGAAAIQFAKNSSRVLTPKYRKGNGVWINATWQQAMNGIADEVSGIPDLMANTKTTHGADAVTFLGCSHTTNEANYIYRKLIAQFGTNNTEHQARI